MMKSDIELLKTYNGNRDGAAINELFCRHYPAVYRVLLHVIHNSTDASDLTQRVFLKAIKNSSKYEAKGSFRNWLLTIAVNEARDFYRNRSREPGRDPLFELYEKAAGEEGPAESTQRRDFEQQLELALEKLPEKLKVPLVLHYYESLTYDEIAEVLDTPKSTIQSRLETAIKRLRSIFKETGHAALIPLIAAFIPSASKTAATAGVGIASSVSKFLTIGGVVKTEVAIAATVCLIAIAAIVFFQFLLPPAPISDSEGPDTDGTAESAVVVETPTDTGESSSEPTIPEEETGDTTATETTYENGGETTDENGGETTDGKPGVEERGDIGAGGGDETPAADVNETVDPGAGGTEETGAGPSKQTGTVYGVVTMKKTGACVDNIHIEARLLLTADYTGTSRVDCGDYKLQVPPEVDIYLVVFKGGKYGFTTYRTAAFSVSPGEEKRFDIAIEPQESALLKIRLVDAVTKLPFAPRKAVLYMSHTRRETYRMDITIGKVSENGEFEIPVHPGKCSVHLVVDGRKFKSGQLAVTAGKVTSINAVLEPPETSDGNGQTTIVEGYVTDLNDGSPLGGVIIQPSLLDSRGGFGPHGPHFSTFANGYFQIRASEGGRISINFWKAGYASQKKMIEDLQVGKATRLDVELEPSWRPPRYDEDFAVVQGICRDRATGEPLSGVLVEFANEEEVVYKVETGASGRFAILTFEGDYYLRATLPYYTTHEGKILKIGKTYRINYNIDLTYSPTRLTVLVIDRETGARLTNTDVVLRSRQSKREYPSKTDENGYFTVIVLAEVSRFQVDMEGFTAYIPEITLREGFTTTVTAEAWKKR